MVLIDKVALLNKIATEVHYDSERSLEMYAKMLSLINDAPEVALTLVDANGNAVDCGRQIDADKLKEHYSWWEGGSQEMTLDRAKQIFDTIIDVQPTVDAVPVVRCDDCIYRDGQTPGQPNILCWQMHADDFCSYGTKREVGTYCEDIVSVVRCKDCENWVENEHCLAWAYEYSDADGYCYFGKRREDAKIN